VPDAAVMRTVAELAMKALPLALAIRGIPIDGDADLARALVAAGNAFAGL
jgi:hypothetical protein